MAKPKDKAWYIRAVAFSGERPILMSGRRHRRWFWLNRGGCWVEDCRYASDQKWTRKPEVLGDLVEVYVRVVEEAGFASSPSRRRYKTGAQNCPNNKVGPIMPQYRPRPKAATALEVNWRL